MMSIATAGRVQIKEMNLATGVLNAARFAAASLLAQAIMYSDSKYQRIRAVIRWHCQNLGELTSVLEITECMRLSSLRVHTGVGWLLQGLNSVLPCVCVHICTHVVSNHLRIQLSSQHLGTGKCLFSSPLHRSSALIVPQWLMWMLLVC